MGSIVLCFATCAHPCKHGRRRGVRVDQVRASICYKSRGLAAVLDPTGPGRLEMGNTRIRKWVDKVSVLINMRYHGISLVSSVDPIIHMWISISSLNTPNNDPLKQQRMTLGLKPAQYI